ncbi:hypothetical protein LINPERPRIM_LOCUS3216 [Linum perenne]
MESDADLSLPENKENIPPNSCLESNPVAANPPPSKKFFRRFRRRRRDPLTDITNQFEDSHKSSSAAVDLGICDSSPSDDPLLSGSDLKRVSGSKRKATEDGEGSVQKRLGSVSVSLRFGFR